MAHLIGSRIVGDRGRLWGSWGLCFPILCFDIATSPHLHSRAHWLIGLSDRATLSDRWWVDAPRCHDDRASHRLIYQSANAPTWCALQCTNVVHRLSACLPKWV